MRALLDMNVMLALFDPEHAHHVSARTWWIDHRSEGWASCPLTQNGFVRIISNPRYPRPLLLADAASIMQAQLALPEHEFWPDNISIADPTIFDFSRILGPSQITDIYLLALAVKNKGRFVTFDQAIPMASVRRAEQQHVAVL